MVIFETQSIYNVEAGDVQLRMGSVTPVERKLYGAKQPLSVHGLVFGDFAVFLTAIDESGAEEIPYLVTKTSKDSTTIVPEEVIASDPQKYGTIELARLLQSLDYDSLAEFGIQSLASQLTNRFPPKK